MIRRIEKILERWFVLEPPLFQVLCLHELVSDPSLECIMRSGRRRLEFNPDALAGMSDPALEELMKFEAVRILLKHPYERFPDGCCMVAACLGSEVTVSDNYIFCHHRLYSPEDFSLQRRMYYEWYAMKIQEMLPPSPEGDPTADCADDSQWKDSPEGVKVGMKQTLTASQVKAMQEAVALWEEDEMMSCQINNVIDSTKDWGTMPGNLQQVLKASLKAKIDWRKILSGFRASILSSERKSTRMRPNRRSGFDALGSVRRFNTKLLVAVDVSGSITDKSVSDFYGVVNSAFRYGFEAVDVLQFDQGVRSVVSLTKAVRDFAVCGRGGTSFQEPIDYAHANGYEGLVILTDGYAPQPEIPLGMKARILWVCVDRESYDQHKEWMSDCGRVCAMQLRK